jgi:hypothetical protein
MSASRTPSLLTKRERQIMDVLYRLGRATAAEIMDAVPGAPGYSTVRTQLRVLETKGHVKHEEQGLRYLYMPTVRGGRRGSRPSNINRHLLRWIEREGRRGAAAARRPGFLTRAGRIASS